MPSSTTEPQQRYDRNGQVYTETVLRQRPVFKRALQAISKLPLERRGSRKAVKGSPSLEETCIRECLRNIKEIDAEILECVPWHVGRKLWDTVEDINPQDIRTVWQAFAAAYPQEKSISYHRSADSTPYETLPEYISSLTSPTASWLTALTISNLSYYRADMAKLSELSNLLALDICGSNPKSTADGTELVDDNVIRAWARHTSELDRLPKLRVLVLRNQPGVTARSFEYLNSFPSLTLFGVKGCSISYRHNKSANLVGWSICDSSNDADLANDLRRDIEFAHTWDEPLKSCIQRANMLAKPNKETDDDTIATDADVHADSPEATTTPLLSFRIGPTSNDVLFSTPLLFFRCGTPQTARKHPAPSSSTTNISDIPTPDATNLQISAEVPTAALSENRKPELRRTLNTISGRSTPNAIALGMSSVGDEQAGAATGVNGVESSATALSIAKRPKLRAEALRNRDLKEQFLWDGPGAGADAGGGTDGK